MTAPADNDWVPDPDIETPDALLHRFGIKVRDIDVADGTAAMSMSLAGMRNPVTNLATIGPLAILIDAVSGMVNHLRRNINEWTVTSELTLELSPDGSELVATNPDIPVVASGRPLGPKGNTSLSFCTLACGDTVIGGGTVRSYFIPTDGVFVDEPADKLDKTLQVSLAELMAIRIQPATEGICVLAQVADPILNNAIGVVNGGVAAAGTELAASAAINADDRPPMRTASLRVNYFRPFYASEHSRYEATPLRIGRGTAVADAQALADDDRVALTARITAYR